MARIRGAFNFCDCDSYATLFGLIGFSLFSHPTSRCHTASSRQLTHSLTHPPTNLNSFTYEIVGLSRARLQLTRFSSIRYSFFLIWFISIKSFHSLICFVFVWLRSCSNNNNTIRSVRIMPSPMCCYTRLRPLPWNCLDHRRVHQTANRELSLQQQVLYLLLFLWNWK